MIRAENLSPKVFRVAAEDTYLVRFYDHESDDPFAPYVATCVAIVFGTHADIKGMCGAITLPMLIELAHWFNGERVKTVWAERVGNKRLPLFTRHPDGTQSTQIATWMRRFPPT